MMYNAVAERKHEYTPRGSQAKLFGSRDPEIVLSGPAGTGKSRVCLEKLFVVANKYPGMRGLIVRKTLASLGGTALQTWTQYVIPEALQADQVQFKGAAAQRPAQYEFDNGSVIVIGGVNYSDRIMSSEYDIIYVQEATELTEDDWEKLTTRLRNGVVPYQQLIADCNPNRPQHWLHQRMVKGKTLRFDTRHEENPMLYTLDGVMTPSGQSYMAKLEALTGVRHKRLRLGQWVGAEGLIYEGFEPSLHLLDRVPAGPSDILDHNGIPLSWDRWWAVDFGYTNPFTLQMWAEDPDGRLYLYREFYQTQQLVADMIAQVLEAVTVEVDLELLESYKANPRAFVGLLGRHNRPPELGDSIWLEPEPRGIICDHDAENRAQLESAFGATTTADKRVSAGLEAVQSRLRLAGDGKPRLYILRDCLVQADPELVDSSKPISLQDELGGYVWGKEETPLKEDDHGCDAMRYMVAERDLGIVGQPIRGFF
jgi:phage terminase large subunit